jgi:RNA polymerase sigma-70 factor, ECF subfamily
MTPFHDKLVGLLPRLRRFAQNLAGSISDGEDLLHSAVERALKNEPAPNELPHLDRWMFRVIKNLWIDELRSKRRQNVPLEMVEDVMSDYNENTEKRLDLEKIRRTLLGLPDDQRAVFTLVVLEGMSYQDCATTLDIPTGTVMSRLSRARSSIAAKISYEPLKTATRKT